MNYVVIIPARMNSSRFPNKPLKKILGIPMLQHCYGRVAKSVNTSKIYITSGDREIENFSLKINANFIKTSKKCKSATERSYQAYKLIQKKEIKKIDLITMIQGDEPLLDPSTISKSIKLLRDKKINIVNVLSPIQNNKDFLDKNNVKAVINKKNEIVYYSREAIPSNLKSIRSKSQFIQTGIISFKKSALIQYFQIKKSILEDLESVDMNRFIDYGIKIHSITSKNYTFGVDNKKDLMRAEKILKNDLLTKLYI